MNGGTKSSSVKDGLLVKHREKSAASKKWFRKTAVLGDATFGATTFCAARHPVESCGSNGLPLTPNSVHILGRFTSLKTKTHPNLCSYVNLSRSKNERLLVVSEYHPTSLQSLIQRKLQPAQVLKIARDIIEGLNFLHNNGMVHRNLHPKNIVMSSSGDVKLWNYGLYYMTGYGNLVTFPIGYPKYLAPEVYLEEKPSFYSRGEIQLISEEELRLFSSGPPADLWAFGVILFELATGIELWSELRNKLGVTVRKILSLVHAKGTVVQRLVQEADAVDVWEDVDQRIKTIIERCLQVDPQHRPSAAELLSEATLTESAQCDLPVVRKSLSSDLLTISHILSQRSLSEVFHWWNLAGGDVETELRKAGILKTKPPIFSLPCVVLEEGESVGHTKDRTVLWDDSVVEISLESLYQRLKTLPVEIFNPSFDEKGHVLVDLELYPNLKAAAALPLIIKEKDIDYQIYRIALFGNLLQGYPNTRPTLAREAREDIPPFYRGPVWAALLKVGIDYREVYEGIDKESPHPSDRQIEVDIPRCHQYMDLLASPEGHVKLKRILKAWVAQNPQYVYWQGLDSLCAPLLVLNFDDEALAYSCLSAFIPKYLHNFFWKDNSAVIQEYLAKFSHLIAFHDPVLRIHLDSIGFVPDLYAIPWFLTMFAHVFPVHKIFHLWDKLLLGNSSFPLCIGLAVLQQLRDSLLQAGFNECILLFSDMPEIDIERCVKDSIEIFCSTPKSVTYREFEPMNVSPKSKKYSWDFSVIAHSLDLDCGSLDPMRELGMDPIPLAVLKSETCPRLSAEDLIELLDLSKTKFSRPKILVVDVRSPEKFQCGAVPGSINMPYLSTWTMENNGSLLDSDQLEQLKSVRGKIICVIGSSRNDLGLKFAEILFNHHWPRVCTLHKGFDVLLKTQILVVPAAVGMI